MIEAVRLARPDGAVDYTGIDLFEARSSADGPGISLKLAHRHLSASGAKVRLVPGDPLSAFARTANSLINTDLLVVSVCCDQASMSAAWFFIPRILHADSLVFEEEIAVGGTRLLRSVSHEEIANRAAQARRRTAA